MFNYYNMQKYAGHLEGIKWFPPKYAVRGLSLGVPKGECFGLLGVNGEQRDVGLIKYIYNTILQVLVRPQRLAC